MLSQNVFDLALQVVNWGQWLLHILILVNVYVSTESQVKIAFMSMNKRQPSIQIKDLP